MTMAVTLGKQVLRIGPVRRAALTAGAARGHGLVFVFHRVHGNDEDTTSPTVVPSIPESVLRSHIAALLEVGEIVDLEDLLTPRYDWRRPRFALTFDDDYRSHYLRALPALQRLNVTASFFLSGRSLHGLGALWFETLDTLIRARGVREVARWLNVETDDLGHLARTCEAEPRLQAKICASPDGQVTHVTASDIRALADAGMTIGFHTLQHRVLPSLADAALDEALTRGRGALEEAAGRPIRIFAYPHGKADGRVRTRLAKAGFVAACTGEPTAFRPGHDPYGIGRWEPGRLTTDHFMAGVAARLSGWRNR